MLLNWNLNGHPMGSELDTKRAPGLINKRSLCFEFHGAAPVKQLQIIRNNRIVHTVNGNGTDIKACWEDSDPIDNITMMPNNFSPNPYLFYYIHVVQENGEMAWASPIWIDVK